MSNLKRQPSHLVASIIFTACALFGTVVSTAAEVTLDGTLGPAGPLMGPDYLIPDSVGSRAGTNLFHSFDKFNIQAGESATFTNIGAPLDNVISRVTGGPSTIDGLLRSTIAGADFFFLNPAGVMFGPNASLDVPASFHTSTADYIKFSDGERFYANSAASSILTVASPEAFGFLGPSSGDISIDRSVLQVPYGETLSLVGGPLNAINDPYSPEYFDYNYFFYGPKFYLLNAPSGVLNLVSVDSQGEVGIDQPDVSHFVNLGPIEFINGANITVSSDLYASGPAGIINISGGNILFQDIGLAGISAGIEGSGSPAGLIDISGDNIHLDNASAGFLNVGVDKIGDAIRLNLNADILLTNGSYLDTSSYWGNAGGISLKAERIILGDDDAASSLYAPYGFYGNISSRSESGSMGQGGDIVLNAHELTIQNGFAVFTASAADDGWYGPGYGDAGDIIIQGDKLTILNKAQVGSNAFGIGGGGLVDVVVRDVIISDKDHLSVINSDLLAGIAANTRDSHGGTVKIIADTIRLEDGGQISTVLYGIGTGADVLIDAESLTVSGFTDTTDIIGGVKPYGLSAVDGRLFGLGASGNGGNITITVDQLQLENGGTVRTGLYNEAPGYAGNIDIVAKDINITSLGQVYADSFRGTGDSGDITINAEDLSIVGIGNSLPKEPLDFTYTGISTTTNSGHGGTITANLSGNLTMANRGGVKADTQGAGTGGDIDLAARNFYLNSGSSINSSSTGSGNAGDISLNGAETLQMRNSAINTEASAEADGGNIDISVRDLLYLYNSKITSSVGGGPETTGGNITIDPEFVVLNNSQIVANAFAGTGGNIQIVADTFLADPQSLVDASSQLGVSGTVDIQAPINNISGLVPPLSTEFTSASALLKERCIARLREGSQYSSFVIGGRDGLPIEPGNLLPSTIY